METEQPHNPLEELTRLTAEQIILACQPGATSSPEAAQTSVEQLLGSYLDNAGLEAAQMALAEAVEWRARYEEAQKANDQLRQALWRERQEVSKLRTDNGELLARELRRHGP